MQGDQQDLAGDEWKEAEHQEASKGQMQDPSQEERAEKHPWI